MKIYKKVTQELIYTLKKDGIGVLPTDTIYGLVGSALSKKAVERIYRVRKRDKQKPFIVLISSFNDLRLFDVSADTRIRRALQKLWPGPVSVILPCPSKKFLYLHRGTKTLAFRMPSDRWLRNVLKRTGPLVAPSANPAGKLPAYSVQEAKLYFGDKIDFYLDKGPKKKKSSLIIEVRRV